MTFTCHPAPPPPLHVVDLTSQSIEHAIVCISHAPIWTSGKIWTSGEPIITCRTTLGWVAGRSPDKNVRTSWSSTAWPNRFQQWYANACTFIYINISYYVDCTHVLNILYAHILLYIQPSVDSSSRRWDRRLEHSIENTRLAISKTTQTCAPLASVGTVALALTQIE